MLIDEGRTLKGAFEASEWHEVLSSKILNLNELLRRVSQLATPGIPMTNTTLFKLERITLAVNVAS
jgi:hypothetical protein